MKTTALLLLLTFQAGAPVLGFCDYMGDPQGVVDGFTKCQHKFNDQIIWWVKS